MSDRIAVMSKGEILQIGPPVEIYERPNCRFVADFIGETNFLTGVVVGLDGNRAVVQPDSLGLTVAGLAQGDLKPGQRVVISARPEKIRLQQTPDLKLVDAHSHKNIFPVRVTNTAYVGSDTRIIAILGQVHRLVIWEQNNQSKLDPGEFYSQGDEAYLYIPPENALVLAED